MPVLSRVKPLQTDRQTDRQRAATENITTPDDNIARCLFCCSWFQCQFCTAYSYTWVSPRCLDYRSVVLQWR